jgi:hypothetical protein
MLLELVQGGELWSLLYTKKALLPLGPYGGLPAPEARFYAGIVTETFRYIHSLGTHILYDLPVYRTNIDLFCLKDYVNFRRSEL